MYSRFHSKSICIEMMSFCNILLIFEHFSGSENNVADENSNETDQTDSKEDSTNDDDDSKETVTENTGEDNNSEEDKDEGMLPFNA